MSNETKKQTMELGLPSMKLSLTTIDPGLASEILKKNIGNRTLNAAHVTRLAKEMTNGRWKFNGDTICINGTRVIDGQHRLHAVIQSGVAIQALLIDGLPHDVFNTKDVGKIRTSSDTLSVAGEQNTTRLAAALVLVEQYYTGRVMANDAYTNTEIEALLAKHYGVRHSIQSQTKSIGFMKPSVLDACHYLFSQKDPKLANEFVDKVVRGIGVVEGSAWHRLRERLNQNAASKTKMKKSYMFALCIKAWNHARAGTSPRILRFAQDGANVEAFPVIK